MQILNASSNLVLAASRAGGMEGNPTGGGDTSNNSNSSSGSVSATNSDSGDIEIPLENDADLSAVLSFLLRR